MKYKFILFSPWLLKSPDLAKEKQAPVVPASIISPGYSIPITDEDGAHMGGCQNYGPFCGTLNYGCRFCNRYPKRDPNFDNYPHEVGFVSGIWWVHRSQAP